MIKSKKKKEIFFRERKKYRKIILRIFFSEKLPRLRNRKLCFQIKPKQIP